MTGSTRDCWLRARRPEEKAQRRDQILAAAAELFDDGDLDAVSMSAIAKRAGIAKGNLYRYFRTKEELFLQLYREDFAEYVGVVEVELASLAGSGDLDAVAAVVTGPLLERPRLASLTSLLAGVLERNLTEDAVAGFKEAVNVDLMRFAVALQAALPEVELLALARMLTYLHALIAGLWPMGNPSPVLARVLERPELAHMTIDFRLELEPAVRAMMRGVLADSSTG